MVTAVDGRDVSPTLGRLVQPDGWAWAVPLQPSGWSAADFRLPSANYPDRSWAVKVTVTGRTVQKGRIRVKIEFVGDGEPSTFHSGWMTLTS